MRLGNVCPGLIRHGLRRCGAEPRSSAAAVEVPTTAPASAGRRRGRWWRLAWAGVDRTGASAASSLISAATDGRDVLDGLAGGGAGVARDEIGQLGQEAFDLDDLGPRDLELARAIARRPGPCRRRAGGPACAPRRGHPRVGARCGRAASRPCERRGRPGRTRAARLTSPWSVALPAGTPSGHAGDPHRATFRPTAGASVRSVHRHRPGAVHRRTDRPSCGPALLTNGQRRADQPFMPRREPQVLVDHITAGEDVRHEEDQIDVTITSPKRLGALALAPQSSSAPARAPAPRARRVGTDGGSAHGRRDRPRRRPARRAADRADPAERRASPCREPARRSRRRSTASGSRPTQANTRNIQFNYQANGSGAGIKAITEQTVDFGASDAAMKDEEIAALQAGTKTSSTSRPRSVPSS